MVLNNDYTELKSIFNCFYERRGSINQVMPSFASATYWGCYFSYETHKRYLLGLLSHMTTLYSAPLHSKWDLMNVELFVLDQGRLCCPFVVTEIICFE
jgi:hypothetical protein